MPTDAAKVAAMRERARRKMAEEKRNMNAKQKAQLPEIQKRLARKVRSSLTAHPLVPADA